MVLGGLTFLRGIGSWSNGQHMFAGLSGVHTYYLPRHDDSQLDPEGNFCPQLKRGLLYVDAITNLRRHRVGQHDRASRPTARRRSLD
jgi:hypothetical protein